MTEDFAIFVDGVPVPARHGDTVASALLRCGQPLPIFCVMGVCQLCCVLINGAPTEACRAQAFPGLTVSRR